MRIRTTWCFAVMLWVASTAFAVGKSPGTTTESEMKEHTSDAKQMGPLTTDAFVNKAAMAGMKEVEASKIALDKAQSQSVKSFAQQMVNDHSKANEQLQTLASSKGWTVPSSLDAKHQADLDKLRNLSGDAFDKAYTEQMRKDHAKAVQLFSQATTATQLDPDLRQFAKQTLPTLQHHRQVAMQQLPAKTAKGGG